MFAATTERLAMPGAILFTMGRINSLAATAAFPFVEVVCPAAWYALIPATTAGVLATAKR